MNTIFDIQVIEKPILVKDVDDNSWKTVPVNFSNCYLKLIKTNCRCRNSISL